MVALALVAHLAFAQAGDGPAAGAEPAVPSIWSAKPLEGGSVASAWAGFAGLGVAYAQGVTEVDDLGVLVDLDWATTELRLSSLYRRPLGTLGGWDLAGRITAGWYAGFGSTWVEDGNRSDRGIDVAPAAVLSHPLAGGKLSLSAELPITFTLRRNGGVLLRPQAWVGYEVGLWSDVALGARAMVGWRKGLGDAPLPEPAAQLAFLVTATYRVF